MSFSSDASDDNVSERSNFSKRTSVGLSWKVLERLCENINVEGGRRDVDDMSDIQAVPTSDVDHSDTKNEIEEKIIESDDSLIENVFAIDNKDMERRFSELVDTDCECQQECNVRFGAGMFHQHAIRLLTEVDKMNREEKKKL